MPIKRKGMFEITFNVLGIPVIRTQTKRSVIKINPVNMKLRIRIFTMVLEIKGIYKNVKAGTLLTSPR